MGLFDFFKRRGAGRSLSESVPSGTPADLRATLFAAAERGDAGALDALRRAHGPAIREAFPAWRKVPADVRADPAAADRYCRALIAVATEFERAGDSSLIELLAGGAGDNPLAAWERDLTGAESCLARGDAASAVALLEGTLERARGMTGPGVDHYLPRTLGLLGAACYRAGDTARAAEHTRRARDLCAATGDTDGVAVYEENLRQIEAPPAAADADASDVIFTDPSTGRRLTRADLAGATGTVNWEIAWVPRVTGDARDAHAQARAAGAAGEYDRALELLAVAARLAPDWPYPRYDAAFTHLLRGDAAQALELYEQVDALAPRGFFTAKAALDSLRRERDGRAAPGSYLKLLSAEWTADPAARRRIVEEVLAASPDLPAAWKELAVLAEDDAAKLASIENGLARDPDPETRGVLEINRALLSARRGDPAAAVAALGALATDPASTIATVEMAKAALATLVDRA